MAVHLRCPHQPVLERIDDQFEPAVYFQLVKHRRQMMPDRRLRDKEILGDKLVLHPFADKLHHFLLPQRQAVGDMCLRVLPQELLLVEQLPEWSPP